MKHRFISIVLFLSAVLAMPELQAQSAYQVPNAGFEDWDSESLTAEPTHWNSFATSDGPWAALASSPHHYHRHGSRPGGTGTSYLTIYTQSILGIKANGNMTTGRIHAGSMSASSSDNYNYTERSNAEHSVPFTATPDSMYVWVSFYAYHTGSEAQVEAIIHGDNDFKAPNDVSDLSKYKGRAVVHTTRTTENPSTMSWTQLRCPFGYRGTAEGRYLLLNMTTNNSPGAGEGNDSLSIDDIEFIYSSWLTSITLDGTALAGFDKGQLNYSVRLSDTSKLMTAEVAWVTEVDDAMVTMERERLSDSTARVLLTVRAEDSVTVHQYAVTLTAPLEEEEEPVGIADVQADKMFTAYPNPVKRMLTITAGGLVTVTDMAGCVVMEKECNGTTQIDMSHLAAGMYIVRSNGKALKIVKE